VSDSSDIFLYLNDMYSLLPEKDKVRFGETWKAYEQTYGSVWMRLFERRLATRVDDVPLYSNYRWLKHTFDSTTAFLRAASYRTNQDLSKGLNLTTQFLIKIAVDGGTPIELDLRGVNAASTSAQEIADKINSAFGFRFATLVVQGALIDLRSNTTGPGSTITFYPASQPLQDANTLVLGLDLLDLPLTLPELRYSFILGDKFIVGIPTFQDKIHDELATVNLVETTDYKIEFGSGVISFRSPPPSTLWAKDNLVNQETPYNNFGYLMDIYDQNTPSYLKAVKGLWFAFWTGPRPENIKRSLYLLFGLPTASSDGTVLSASDTSITLQYLDKTTETFAVPTGLTPIVYTGATVTRFQPLVSGINVLDKINSPGFLAREIGRPGLTPFLTEKATLGMDPSTDESKALKTVEENTYLPQIDVNAFISPDIKLGNVKTYLRNIQPKSRTFLFQVLVGTFRDRLAFENSSVTACRWTSLPTWIPTPTPSPSSRT
jgi:hypothetical protein